MFELAWYILTVSPLCEGAVANRLKRRFGDHVETCIPISVTSARRRHQRVEVVTKVFPRYLFVGFKEPPQWLYVLATMGVRGVISTSGTPLHVDARLVGDLMSRCLSGFYDPPAAPKIQKGMHVVPRAGPFRGSTGKVVSISKPDQHAHIVFELFEGTVPARIHLDDLVSVSYASMRMTG